MALTQDILATYRGPARVVGRFLSQGRNEVRALLFILIAGLLIFVAQAPYQARAAELTPEGPLAVRLYWAGLLWVFLFPILLYAFAAVIWALSRLAGRKLSGYAVRFTLFWAVLASTPIVLLMGLVAGFIGPGIELQSVTIVWLCVFMWFWISGLLTADRAAP